jgi:hypothetical protein
MINRIALLLFIGLAFWSCEDKSEPSLIGTWEYIDTEVETAHISDSYTLSYIDSIGLRFIFTKDSVFTNDNHSLKRSYTSSSDSIIIKDFIRFRYELESNELNLYSRQTMTDDNGDLIANYEDKWLFNRQ